ncbi:MAG: glycosyltransferase family 4 protein [Candidatus Sulfotelmatobacter sp.]
MIKLFTPSFADEGDTNAQNLSVKEIVARLDPDRIAVTMFHESASIDPRIATRRNTILLPWRSHGNTWRTALHILHKTPDVYFFPREGPLDTVFLTLRRLLHLKTTIVTYIVSGGLYNGEYPPARVKNIREADVVVANNDYLGQLLAEKYNVQAETIYDGVDRRHYFPPASDRAAQEPVTVLFAGSLRPYKRVTIVVRQAARWPQVRFRVAGVGEEQALCKNLAAELKCVNVNFLGHLSPAQLGEEMRRADVFFLPSVLEGHPQVLLQAAACGLPAIAMELYRPDGIVDGLTGFLAHNDSELSEKLALMLSQADLRLAMGKAAVNHAQRFDWDSIAHQWQTVFEQAVLARGKA